MIPHYIKLISTIYFFQEKEVPSSVQLFYIGVFVFIMSIFFEFIDEEDKFFTPEIGEIPPVDIAICLGVGSIGNFFLTIFCC